jgi:methylmalonyl-CoA/ethylmalonyl-CoA epimerase
MAPTDEALGSLVVAVDHVGIAVPDLDEAIRWYADTLGLVSTHEETNTEQGVREAMLAAPGDRTGATMVQLLAPLDENSTIAKFIDRNGPGLQQVAYRVRDVAEAGDALRAKGLRMLYDEPRRGTSDSRVNFVHPKDAGGVLVELVEPAAQPH